MLAMAGNVTITFSMANIKINYEYPYSETGI
jgi:hypothetical protein